MSVCPQQHNSLARIYIYPIGPWRQGGRLRHPYSDATITVDAIRWPDTPVYR